LIAAPLDRRIDVVYMHEMTSHQNIPALARTLLDACLCHNVRMASRIVSRAYDEALRPTGLRATQVAVLAAVAARGALSIKSLADSLEMERTTLTRNLRPLEEQGLVAIAPEGRHRSRMLTLTTAGRAALMKALPLWEKAQQSSMHQLGEPRWPVVQKALADLVSKMHRTAS
jgi:DNA-binding MarR family transcriptional regulator